MQPNNTITHKNVKIFAPFRLEAAQRRVIVGGQTLNVAAPAGRQDGEYLYAAEIMLVREDTAVYTTAPNWASVEIQ